MFKDQRALTDHFSGKSKANEILGCIETGTENNTEIVITIIQINDAAQLQTLSSVLSPHLKKVILENIKKVQRETF